MNEMTAEEIILKELNEWIFNLEDQTGNKLNVIEAIDFPEIINNISKKLKSIHAKPSDSKERNPAIFLLILKEYITSGLSRNDLKTLINHGNKNYTF